MESVQFLRDFWKKQNDQEDAILESLGRCRRLAKAAYIQLVKELHGAAVGANVKARIPNEIDENGNPVYREVVGHIVEVLQAGNTAKSPELKPMVRIAYRDGDRQNTRLSNEWELLGEWPEPTGCVGTVGVVG